jgi:GT2 family glycosyltransferase
MLETQSILPSTLDDRRHPQVAIVVLNWNRKKDTLCCLESLTKIDYPRYEVIVVDNGSTDGSVEALREAFPDPLLIQTGSNLGYAGGNNIGIERAFERGADYVLVLNNDTMLDSFAVRSAVDVAQTIGDKAGVIGFATYDYDHPEALNDLGLAYKGKGRFRFHLPTQEELENNNFLPIESAHGCAMLLTRLMLEKVGLLHEEFFLMDEEIDLCARARRAGFAVVGATKARVWHKGSATFGGAHDPLKLFYLYRNTLLYMKRRYEEENQLEEYRRFLRTYAAEARDSAIQYLRENNVAAAFNQLLAVRCAEAELWGKKHVPVTLRAKLFGEILVLGLSGILRRFSRHLRSGSIN